MVELYKSPLIECLDERDEPGEGRSWSGSGDGDDDDSIEEALEVGREAAFFFFFFGDDQFSVGRYCCFVYSTR